MIVSRLACLGRGAALALGLTVAASAAVSCGSDADDSLFPNGGAPCDGPYKGKCGTDCTTDSTCSDGLHCAAFKCTADCLAGSTCADGVSCTERGRCGGFDGMLGDGGTTGTCPTTNVEFAKLVPKVLFLLDQSSSMYKTRFPSGDTPNCTPDCRWTVLKDVLIGPANDKGGLLKALEGQAEMALQLYSATDSVQDGDDSYLTGPVDAVCPRFNGKTFSGLSFSLNAYAGAETLLRPAAVDDDTPTGPAIRTVVGLAEDGSVADAKGFASVASNAPKVLVLVTDGEPAICNENTPSDAGRALVVKAVQDTYKQGITTFVIAIGDTSGTAGQHFNAVANAGQGLDPVTGKAKAITPTTQQALVDALKKVVLDARTCEYDLNGSVAAGKEGAGTVTLNGSPLPYAPPGAPEEGWRLVNPSRIELLGAACATLKSTPDAVLSVQFPCGSITR